MSQTDYISKEVEKIISNKEFAYPMNMAMASAWMLGNLKAFNLKVLNTEKSSSLADFYIIGSATNITQAQAMAETIMVQLKKHGANPRSTEGTKGADWILIDLGDIIVHIFLDTARSVYDLDSLWATATVVDIPQDYYFSSEDEGDQGSGSNDGSEYF